ncbi:MAG: alpha/beta fold hydrolase [Deltaproteobacteria bacterium]|nr:alpha/beta fold hydrolase [Deltaproteobacteria bacterium]
MIIFRAILYIVLIIVSLDIFILYMNSHPQRYSLYIPPSEFGITYEEAQFDTSDGIRLKGWFIKGNGKGGLPTVIVCHGLGANRSDFTELAAGLSRGGYNVLLFDFRGHGDSQRVASSFGYLEQKDILGAIRYVKERKDVDAEWIAVYGFSMGGAVAVLTAAETSDIKAVIADSSFTALKEQGERLFKGSFLPSSIFLKPMVWMYELYFRVDADEIEPINKIHRLSPAAIMIIGGGEDEQMPSSDAMRLFAAAREPKELWLVPGAVHGGTVYMTGDEYRKRVLRFLDTHLKRK